MDTKQIETLIAHNPGIWVKQLAQKAAISTVQTHHYLNILLDTGSIVKQWSTPHVAYYTQAYLTNTLIEIATPYLRDNDTGQAFYKILQFGSLTEINKTKQLLWTSSFIKQLKQYRTQLDKKSQNLYNFWFWLHLPLHPHEHHARQG